MYTEVWCRFIIFLKNVLQTYLDLKIFSFLRIFEEVCLPSLFPQNIKSSPVNEGGHKPSIGKNPTLFEPGVHLFGVSGNFVEKCPRPQVV